MHEPQPSPAQRLGRHMMVVAWILALTLLGLLFSDLLEKQRNPNADVRSTIAADGQREIVLQRNRQGHYFAGGRINRQAVTFLLDTGATVVSVPQHIADRLGLKRGTRSYATTANGVITTYATRLDSVAIGDIELRNVAAHINPYSDSDDILLGMSFLKQLELTQRGDKLTLRQ